MPSIDDYSKDDEQSDMPSGGSRGVSSSGGGQPSNVPSKQQEPEFVPWSRFVSANQSVSDREAGKLQQNVQNQVNKANQGREAAQRAQETAIASNYKTVPKPAFGTVGPQQNQSQFGQPKAFGASTAAQQMPGWQAPQNSMQKPSNVLGAQQKPQLSAVEMPDRVIDPDKLKTDIADGAFKTSGYGLAGGKDLESQIGKDAWRSLVGDTQKAAEAAKSLGSESGVQALLGQGSSPFDAALISGAGGKGFRDTAKQYGGNELSRGLQNANMGAQQRWSSLMNDVTKAGLARDAEIQNATDNMNRINAQNAASTTPPGSAPPAREKWRPDDWKGADTFDKFTHPEVNDASDFNENMHQAGLALSPTDWATRALGEAGVYNGQNATEAFAGNVSGGGFKKDWWQANMRTALDQVSKEYGNEAAQKWWDSLTPEMWAAYQQYGNSGAMAREMRAWLESAGFKKQAQHQQSQVKSMDAKEGNKEYGTTAEQETARTQAYRDGWGSDWDKQFREGNQNPKRGG